MYAPVHFLRVNHKTLFKLVVILSDHVGKQTVVEKKVYFKLLYWNWNALLLEKVIFRFPGLVRFWI